MKKLLFILTVIVSITTVNSQTKDETIFWLKEYGLDMLNSDPFANGHKWYYYIDDNKFKCEVIFSDDIKYKEISFDCLANAYLEDIIIEKNDSKDCPIITISTQKWCSMGYLGSPPGSSPMIWFPFKNTTSQQDQERFLKAFRHLAQLCGAKEKPKVTKNTF